MFARRFLVFIAPITHPAAQFRALAVSVAIIGNVPITTAGSTDDR
jgi:hypothetical protein